MNPCIIGVEIGGTKLQLAIESPQGDILAVHQGRVAVESGAQGILAWLQKHAHCFGSSREFNRFADWLWLWRAGRYAQRAVLKSIQIQGWDGFPLRQWLQDEFRLPAAMANDTNAAAWGEYNRGSGRGTRHFFYTNLGSGIGGVHHRWQPV
jgi:glucokinase